MTRPAPKGLPAFLKPGQIPREVMAVRVYPDGREVCSTTPEGRALYYERKRIAWEAQGRCCGICLQPMLLREATVDHIRPRGMGSGFRDDRMENIRAAHMICNSNRGSRRDYQ